MSKNTLGLIVGSFLALFHAVWSLAVVIMPVALQSFMNWVLTIHHISLPMAIITPFVLANAVMLVISTFVMGYICGWVLGWLHELLSK